MTYSKSSIFVIAGVAALCGLSQAAPILPGGAILAVPVVPVAGSAVVVDSSSLPFVGTDVSSNVVFFGGETSTVFGGDTNNLLGGLTFVYNLTSNPNSLEAIDRVTVSGFAGYVTDVGFIDPGGTFTPVDVTRSNDGGVIGFDFSGVGLPNNEIPAGGASALLVIRTNAPFDKPVTLSVIDGGRGDVASYGPVPEPASLGILAVGGLAMLRRRRSR